MLWRELFELPVIEESFDIGAKYRGLSHGEHACLWARRKGHVGAVSCGEDLRVGGCLEGWTDIEEAIRGGEA